MRLAPIPPATLTGDDMTLYEEMSDGISEALQGFVSKRDDGALVGPFNPMLHFPQFGKPAWDYTKALIDNTTMPKAPHEVAILVVGAHFTSRYELYAHEKVAEGTDLSTAKIATISAGQRPGDLTPEEGIAYDVASVLSAGGQLPESTYQAALAAFGDTATAELVYLIAGYCLVSVLLNAYDVSVPGRGEGV